ncbi:master DNA invertase Mpi family serine-type recombinase, partial [Selenomonas noxia]|uniref:master DNA invertase Mpi family serine-type recombinase n=1 Tax=Selenomonas noxia TaxID=135083 RepID=UPI0030811F0F
AILLNINAPISFAKERKMNYGYIRVSSDKQTVENQRFEIQNFCQREGLTIDGWIEETVSGTKSYDKRELGTLLANIAKGDLIVCSELSRLGRNLFMIMEILNQCMDKECRVWTIKDSYRLGDDIQSKVLAFAFGLSAEIERNLISQRTKEALARKKAEGVILGRPRGRKSDRVKLSGKEGIIKELRNQGVSISEIARIYKVNRNTVSSFIHTRMNVSE